MEVAIIIEESSHAVSTKELVVAPVKFEKKTKEQELEIHFLREQLAVLRETKGTQHPKTLDLCEKLGWLLKKVREFDEAEDLLRRAWKGRMVAHGPKHISVFHAESNLGHVLLELRRWREARDLFKEALRGLESHLGYSHDDLISCLEGLGNACHSELQLTEAEDCFRRMLEFQFEHHGPENIVTLGTINKLAVVLTDQKRLADADELCSHAFDECSRLLGEDHPITQESVGLCAFVRNAQGRSEEAEEMYRKALSYQERHLGPDHASTVATMSKIAQVLFNRGEVNKAEDLHIRAIDSYERTIGTDHPTTLSEVQSLGALLLSEERILEAERMARRALQGRLVHLGEHHECTQDSKVLLAKVLDVRSHWKHERGYAQVRLEAEQLFEAAIEGRTQLFGSNHVETMTARRYLGEFLLDSTRYKEAEAQFKRVIASVERLHGPNSEQVCEVAYRIGACLQYRGHYRTATPWFRKAHEGFVAARGGPGTAAGSGKRNVSAKKGRGGEGGGRKGSSTLVSTGVSASGGRGDDTDEDAIMHQKVIDDALELYNACVKMASW